MRWTAMALLSSLGLGRNKLSTMNSDEENTSGKRTDRAET